MDSLCLFFSPLSLQEQVSTIKVSQLDKRVTGLEVEGVQRRVPRRMGDYRGRLERGGHCGSSLGV